MSSNHGSGGYDARFVDPLEEHHICFVCHLVLRQPRLTDCGHRFCDSCLSPVSRNAEVWCPICGTQLKTSEIYPDNMAKREILGLQVRCCEEELGCDWQGKLREVEDHKGTCNFGIETCPNGCGERLMRGGMKKHMEDWCLRRIVECPICFGTLEYCLLSDHQERCDHYLVQCIYECGALIPRATMSLHVSLEGTCTRSCLSCEFEHSGCLFKGNRGQMEVHRNQETASHLSMVAKSLQSRLEIAESKVIGAEKQQADTNAKLAIAETKLAAAERRLQQTESKQAETERKLTETRRELSETKSMLTDLRCQSVPEKKSSAPPAKGTAFNARAANPFKVEVTTVNPGHSVLARDVSKVVDSKQVGHKPCTEPLKPFDYDSADFLRSFLQEKSERSEQTSDTFFFVWKINNWYRQLMEAKRTIQRGSGPLSVAFYTGTNGYQLRLEAFLNGHLQYRGTHLSLAVSVLEGKNDSYLPKSQRCSLGLNLCCQKRSGKSKTFRHDCVINSRQKGRLFIAADFVSHEEMAVGHFLALNEIFVVFQFKILS